MKRLLGSFDARKEIISFVSKFLQNALEIGRNVCSPVSFVNMA